MAIKEKANELASLISALQTQRQEHVEAISKIDETFSKYGINAESDDGPRSSASASSSSSTGGKRRGPGRPKGSTNRAKSAATPGKKKTRRGRKARGSFEKTGEESVLDFIRSRPTPPNAKEVNQHWSGEGRGGKADNTISKMVKAGQLARVDIEGERGGRYKAA